MDNRHENINENKIEEKKEKQLKNFKRRDGLMVVIILAMIALISTVATVSIIYRIEGEKNVFYFGSLIKDAFNLINFIA